MARRRRKMPICASPPIGAWCAATMSALSRRRFIAASAASAAAGMARSARAPALAAQASGAVDIVIIGAGAAGIAAARRIAATGAGARLAILEASGRIGGRCFTETTSFGVPYDRGAHWIHMPDQNPVTPLAAASGFDIYPAPPGQRVRISRRNARQGEMEDYLTAVVRANRAIIEAGRGRLDVPATQALPRDLGEWQRTVEFVLGPFGCAKDLADLSAADFSRSAERDTDSFCRQGFGAVIAKLGEGLPVDLSNPVTRIDWGARNTLDIDTAKGRLSVRCAIVTVSTGVLAGGRLKFSQNCPGASLTSSRSCGPAATTISRWNCPATRSASRPTTWCSRNPIRRAPPRFSPMFPGRHYAWSRSPENSAGTWRRAATRP